MEEAVCLEFDHSLSDDPEIRGYAESYIEEQIRENADFYIILFRIFNSSTNTKHRKQSLIYLSKIIKENLNIIKSSLQHFSEQLYETIVNTRNCEFFKFEVEIVYQIILKIILTFEVPWPHFQNFLLLFSRNNDFIYFCAYLYFLCFDNLIIFRFYQDIFSEIDYEITLLGLQHENDEIKILSTNHFINSIMNSNDESKLELYKEHYQIIAEFAEKSNNLDENNFNLFWSQIFDMPTKYIEPFFNLAKSFIYNEKLSQNSQMVLLKIMIRNWSLIDHDDLEKVINFYFNALSQIEDIDYGAVIFTNLSKIDFLQSYELFKRCISIFLEADNDEIQFKGLVLLHGFTKAFVNQINSEISPFIKISLNLATKSIEHFNWATYFICEYLDYNQLNYEDEAYLHDFIYQCFIKSQDDIFNYDAYMICKKMGPDPIYFDKFIEAIKSNEIQSESVPFVLCLLVNLYSPENNLTDEKYEPFINWLCDLFNKYSEEFLELYQEFNNYNEEEDNGDESISDKLYQCTIFRNSISNLVLLFSISNPIKYSENIEKAIQCFTDFCANEDVRELGELYKTNVMHDIKDGFTQIFKINKIKMIEYLRNYYEQISDGLDIDELIQILIEYEGDNFEATDEYAKYFVEIYEDIEANKKMDLNQKINELHSVILPASKWLYRIQDDEIQKKYFKILLFYIKYSGQSYEIFISLTKILRRFVNPEKYIQVCSIFNQIMTNFSENYIPKIKPSTYCQCFEGLVNLMIFFIQMKNEYAHTFLEKYIFPFYEKYTETSEIDLLVLFTKMIDLNFYNANEINAMKQVIDAIIERGKIYLDVRPYLFSLITKITKIEQENASKYYQFGLETFEEVKEEPIFHNVKIHCAHFLLTCFNQDSEQFKEVINLLPSIFSVFTSVRIINDLFEEIKIFIDKNENSFSKEVYELLIITFTRYLSYQENAPFKFNIDLHKELIEIFGKFLEIYYNKFEPKSLEELLTEFLPKQPSSVQYILSLQNQ